MSKIMEPAIQPAEDGGVVSADVEDFLALQVQVAVESFANISFGATRGLKDLERRETEGKS
jgi:hypothetical protein